jgi:hypothetical protein
VLLTRWTIFRAFIEVAKEQNAGKLPPDIKRHWLLFQLLPNVLDGDLHPFLAFMNSRLAGVSTDYLRDEVQVACATHMGAFADANGEIRRSVLHPIHRGLEQDLPFDVFYPVHKTRDLTTRNLQKSYISRYLPSTFLSSPSGTVLVSRMFEWLRGR